MSDTLTITKVEAPNYNLYNYWLYRQKDLNAYRYLGNADQLNGWWGPIIVLNGGSMDPHIRSLVGHPSRAGNVTHMQV
jgi:hypothetical protein